MPSWQRPARAALGLGVTVSVTSMELASPEHLGALCRAWGCGPRGVSWEGRVEAGAGAHIPSPVLFHVIDVSHEQATGFTLFLPTPDPS